VLNKEGMRVEINLVNTRGWQDKIALYRFQIWNAFPVRHIRLVSISVILLMFYFILFYFFVVVAVVIVFCYNNFQ